MNTSKSMMTLAVFAALAWLITPTMTKSAFAQTTSHAEHGDEHKSEHHDEMEGHDHDDGHEHEDHDEHHDEKKGHGHEDGHEHEDHDDHESEGHKGHGDDDGSHEEGKAVISPDSAERMGIVVQMAGPAIVNHSIPLTGRITLNQNKKAEVRARFPGIVRTVSVNLGDSVTEGQVMAVVESNESLQDYNVMAPMNGFVLLRNTNIGDVAGGEALFMIADLSEVWAKFHVFPGDADLVQKGQAVTIHTLEDNKTANGFIDMLFPTADELSQTQIAIVALPNSEGMWKPGMTVEGDVTISQNTASVSVQKTALQKLEQTGDVVFIQDGTSYEARPVKTGRSANGFVEIVEGLKGGERYVAEGSFIIKSDLLKSTAEHSH